VLQPLPGRSVNVESADAILCVSLRDDAGVTRKMPFTMGSEEINELFGELEAWKMAASQGHMVVAQGSAMFKVTRGKLVSNNLLECGRRLLAELQTPAGLRAQKHVFSALYGETAAFREAVRVDVIPATPSQEFEKAVVGPPRLDLYSFVTVFKLTDETRDARTICGVLGELLALQRNCWWSGRHFRLVSVGGGSDPLDLIRVVHHSEFPAQVPGEAVWAKVMAPKVASFLLQTTGEAFDVGATGFVNGPATTSVLVLFSWAEEFHFWSESFIEERRECVKLGKGTSFTPCYGRQF
jgi:hypothetical protein